MVVSSLGKGMLATEVYSHQIGSTLQQSKNTTFRNDMTTSTDLPFRLKFREVRASLSVRRIRSVSVRHARKPAGWLAV